MICDIGVNNMSRGWTRADKWNYRVYVVWRSMIRLCYSEKYHETHPTYKNCTVCERWLKLSNFVEDIVKIDGYNYWLTHPNERVALDKDIKSNGINKCYCLENCMFVSIEENTRQANKTRNYDDMRGENHPMYGHTGEKNPMYGRTGEKHPQAVLVDRFDKQGDYIDTSYQFEYVKMGFHSGDISSCCKGKRKTHKGYIFKYHKK